MIITLCLARVCFLVVLSSFTTSCQGRNILSLVSRSDLEKKVPLLFLGVYTAPTENGKLRRDEIRSSYWNHKYLQPGGPIEAKFVVGWSESGHKHAAALEEEAAQKPGDFLRVDVKEHYTNLTAKTMAFLRWFTMNSKAHFVLKMDDDTFPHFGPIVRFLRNEREKGKTRHLHLGLLFPCAPVLKFTKWAENPGVWNHSYFPKYMQGSGYFLSAPLAQEIGGHEYDSNVKTMLNNEDAAVGVWIEKLKSKKGSKLNIEQRSIPSTLTGCQPGDLLSMNNQLGYMNCYWNRLDRGEKDVCCYGPLNKLRQSLLQVGAGVTTHSRLHSRTQTGCYGEFDDFTGGERPVSLLARRAL